MLVLLRASRTRRYLWNGHDFFFGLEDDGGSQVSVGIHSIITSSVVRVTCQVLNSNLGSKAMRQFGAAGSMHEKVTGQKHRDLVTDLLSRYQSGSWPVYVHCSFSDVGVSH